MNKIQRAKVKALTQCRAHPGSWEERFIRSLDWLRAHDPATTLTTNQRYHLDLAIWRFRRQLAGRENGYVLPTEEPQPQDYTRDRKPPRQGTLL